MVTVGNRRKRPGRCEFTIPYHDPGPNLIHHADRILRRLPNVTGIFARGAKPIGDFGLVYQRLPSDRSGPNPAMGDLYQALPPGYEDRYYRLL